MNSEVGMRNAEYGMGNWECGRWNDLNAEFGFKGKAHGA